MTNLELLSKLQSCIHKLFEVLGEAAQPAAEDEIRYSLELQTDLTQAEKILTNFSQYADILTVNFVFNIHDGKGSASLGSEDYLIVDSWEKDPNLNLPALTVEGDSQFQILDNKLSTQGEKIKVEEFLQNLKSLAEENARIKTSISIFLEKNKFLQKLNYPKNVHAVFYVVSEKLLQLLEKGDYSEISNILVPNKEDTLILLCGDVLGVGKGPNLRILGCDYWSVLEETGFSSQASSCEKVREAVHFCSEESNWEGFSPGLTPYHLNIDTTDLKNDSLVNGIGSLRNRLCAAHLANQCKAKNGVLFCDFRGYKRVEAETPKVGRKTESNELFRLFAWAYDSSSSDKLEIVRQLISLQLNFGPGQNYVQLIEGSKDILDTAKGNYKLYLKRSVELYFDKRLRVSEFLQKFNEEISKSVADLASELTGNLYKTVGIIVGAVIGIVLDPKYTPLIITIVAFLYLIYIGFILVYLLPSTEWRYRNNIAEYNKNVTQLSDILTKEEISNLQKDSFKRAKHMFNATFRSTYAVYELLAIAATLSFIVGLFTFFIIR
jgi:hypothetical protein